MDILSWLKRRRIELDEEDFKEEIRAHLAIATEERTSEGADPTDARYAALREFGNVTHATEATRRVWTPAWLSALHDHVSDVRYALRALVKNPTFSLTVIGVLTLGIGLNAAVFTMLKGFALSPVAGVEGSTHIAVIVAKSESGRAVRLSYPDYQYLRDHDTAFEGLLGSAVTTANLGRGRGARQVWSEIVSGNYFQVLNVRAQLGRPLLPSDEVAPGRHPVVVISDGLWRRDFGADPAIIGKTIEVNNNTLTVVGVTDSTFHGTSVVYDVELYIPVMMAPQLGYTFGSRQPTPAGILADRRATVFYPHGYLKPDTSRANAAAQTDALWNALALERPHTEVAQRLEIVPFLKMPGGAPSYIMPTLGVLSVMGVLVLLIACANIAGLVLVRGVSRRGEIAVRLALGASRTRIVRLLVVESLVLAIPGTAFGILLARNAMPVLIEYSQWLAAPQRLFFNSDIDTLVVSFTALVACASALVFGFVPALQSSRVDLVTVINEDASPRGAPRGRLRTALVVAQVAVSLMLLVGAGLVTRSLEAARRMNPGFDSSLVTSINVDVKQNGYDEARGQVFYQNLLDASRRDADVESAALAASHPLGLLETRPQRLTIEGYASGKGEDLLFSSNTVTPSYFRVLRIPILAGREFDDHDDEAGAPAVIVNHTLAQRFFGGAANAIGKRLRVGEEDWRTITGVAADVKYAQIGEAPRPYFYLPFLQAYRSTMYLHTRGTNGASIEQLVSRARGTVERLDPDLPVLSARPFVEETRGAFLFMDLAAAMLLIFGIAGMVLAALGTYALVSYTVKQRTHEIGIRIALGASTRSVILDFVTRGLRLGLIGVAIGFVAALGISGLLRAVLFGVSPTDLVSFTQALGIVLIGVILATIVPAWRASRTDPLTALRHQ